MTKIVDFEKKEKDVDFEYERRFLNDFIRSMKILKEDFGIKLELVGLLTNRLSEALNCNSDALYFAGYYANIGLMMIDKIISRPEFISSDQERKIIKEHVHYSSHFLESRGLITSAFIVENHHEKPNGKGYFSQPNKDKNAAIVNIADEFVGISSNKSYKPYTIKKIAIRETLKEYDHSTIFTRDEIEMIKSVLDNFYNTIRSVQ